MTVHVGSASGAHEGRDTTEFRLGVVMAALELFGERGFDATTVDDIAGASGISRRTFFRHYRSKEDVVFADHDVLMERTRVLLADEADEDPWEAIKDAILLIFDGYLSWPEVSRKRYRLLRSTVALRERETVTAYRYERLFTEFLRQHDTGARDLSLVQFASIMTSTHNYVLRRVLRGEPGFDREFLVSELDEVCRRAREGAVR